MYPIGNTQIAFCGHDKNRAFDGRMFGEIPGELLLISPFGCTTLVYVAGKTATTLVHVRVIFWGYCHHLGITSELFDYFDCYHLGTDILYIARVGRTLYPLLPGFQLSQNRYTFAFCLFALFSIHSIKPLFFNSRRLDANELPTIPYFLASVRVNVYSRWPPASFTMRIYSS